MAVCKLGGSCDRPSVDTHRALGRETGQSSDVGTEGDCLLPVEVAPGRHHDVPERILAYEHHVDDADDLLPPQAVELREDLAFEVVAVEGDAHHLDRAHRLDRADVAQPEPTSLIGIAHPTRTIAPARRRCYSSNGDLC